ncbi:MAG: hypothetical protein K8R92_06435 [Planctomycetes bacterium]|nr:hypothetical protein [Planctomycetota bacterium]
MKHFKSFAIFIAMAIAGSAAAGYVNVGKIVVDKYELSSGTRTKGPGANMIMHWETNAAFADQMCFTEPNLRWLQLLSCSDAVGGVTPRPNRPFIDLREGQIAPGHPDGVGDGLPFYDFSYPSLGDAQGNTNIKINGSGKYMRDDPRAQVGQYPINFSFITLVVGIMPDNQLAALGGVKWGFDVDKDGKHTLLTLEALSAETIALGRFTNFNQALKQDFKDWVLPSQKTFCPDTQYYFDLAPEPSSLGGFTAFLLSVARGRRRVGLAEAA